jgi:hypothetical protein
MRQKAFIEYRVDGVLSTADTVTIRVTTLDGTEIVPTTSATTDVTGIYYNTFEAQPNIIYKIYWLITPNPGDDPTPVNEEIGPFEDPVQSIRATTDIRGRFVPDYRGTIFIRITDFEGNAQDASAIEVDILDSDSNTVVFGTPEWIETGFYGWDWDVPFEQTAGEYFARWTYTVDGVEHTEMQKLIVSARADGTLLYSGRVVEMRQALTAMISYAQAIPVYREPAKQSRDRKTYEFHFPRWNQSAGVRIYRNDRVVKSGFTIDYFNGTVTFDKPLTAYDRVEAGYNFRWYKDDQLDRFLSNSIHMLNIRPPVTGYSTQNLDDKWIAPVLYGASVDALRNLMLSLQFQDPQLVFGGPEKAEKVYANLEGLKKNYEETWTSALEQKKFGPYKGLTRFMTTPEFAMPGGRSRMFRYMFSSGA